MTSALYYPVTRQTRHQTHINNHFDSEPKVDIIVDRELGSGKFKVFHARLAFQEAEYALKVFPTDKTSKASYQTEKDILSHLKHKNIIDYIPNIRLREFENLNTDYLLMEYAPYGTFYELVLNKALIEEKLIRTYFHQLVNGLEYLHSQGVAHADLKLDNVLMGEEFVLKIIDFDQSQRAGDATMNCRGTACYRAPEVIDGSCKNFGAADIYSLGVMLYTTKAREFPFAELGDSKDAELLHYDLFTENNEEFWKVKVADRTNSEFFSADFKALINGMLEESPSRRLTLSQIKNSRWYNGPIYEQNDLKMKMERIWERITFKKALKRGHSPTNC